MREGLNIDIADKREQRKFGLSMAVAIAVLGLLRWWLSGHAPTVLFPVAAALVLMGQIVPRALKPVLWAWLRFAEALNWVMTRVLLTLAFYLLMTPVRVWIRMFGEDPLKRRWNSNASTYWEDAEEQPEEFERYFNQF